MSRPSILSRRILAADIPGTDLHAGDRVLVVPSRCGPGQVNVLTSGAGGLIRPVPVDSTRLVPPHTVMP